MRQKYYSVYKITNLANDKIYIGAHETYNLNDDYYGSGHAIKAARKKYHSSWFKKELLSLHPSREEMYKQEARLVNEEFILREDTYNIRPGGLGGPTKTSFLPGHKIGKHFQIGNKSMSGTTWVHHPVIRKNKLVNKNFLTYMLSIGWYKGRKIEYYKPSLV